MNLKQPKTEQLTPDMAELERLAESQNVKPFDFDEASGEGAELWNDDEFNEFEAWLEKTRIEDTEYENAR